MDRINNLPEVELYSVGTEEVDRVAHLMTAEAAALIKSEEAFGIAVAEENEVRGAMCARFAPENERCLEILSIYVVPEFRGRGLGTTMLVETIEEILAETEGELTYAGAIFSPGAEGAKELFEKIGFEISEAEGIFAFQVEVGALMSYELLKRKVAPPEGCSLRTVSELSDYDIKMLISELRNNGVDYISVVETANSIKDASYVLFDANGKLIACAIFTPAGEAKVCLAQFFTAGGANAAMSVLQSGAAALAEKLPPDMILEIPTVEESSASLVKKIVPDCKSVKVLSAMLKV